MATDVILIGGGIVGAACARALAQTGLQIMLIDAAPLGNPALSGATGAGMGHLLVLDDNPAELALSRYSVQQWQALAPQLSEDCAFHRCGTLWIAANDAGMAEAEAKQVRFADAGVRSECLTSDQLAHAEPALRPGLAGALKVPDDAIVYAPNAARWLIAQAGERVQSLTGEVTALLDDGVQLADGTRHHARHIVLANGTAATTLCPELPIRPKKGHLLITDRYPGTVFHQLIELGYVSSAHQTDGSSVAFNVQPRPTGQLLIGSSRQFDTTDLSVEPAMLQAMLQRALAYLPGIANLNAIRTWTGLRAATPDGLPIIGAHPNRANLWLAVGHEGVGITNALGTAHLITASITGSSAAFDPAPYGFDRFAA